MSDIRYEILEKAELARRLHLREKSMVLESVKLVYKLYNCNAVNNLGFNDSEKFAAFLGLTIDQYWKRIQAGRTIHHFPVIEDMLKKGETHMSHVVMIAARITEANCEILLEGIKGKTRREIAYLLDCVDNCGNLIEKEPEITITVKLKKSEVALLDRAKEVLSARGKVPGNSEILVRSLKNMLSKRDPMQKAERALTRINKKTELLEEEDKNGKEQDNRDSTEFASSATGQNSVAFFKRHSSPVTGVTPQRLEEVSKQSKRVSATGQKRKRIHIPALIKHLVYKRDGCQCTEIHPDGTRCTEKGMLEIEHLLEWSRGGSNDISNLSLLCRRHNQERAQRVFGVDFMSSKRRRIDKPDMVTSQ